MGASSRTQCQEKKRAAGSWICDDVVGTPRLAWCCCNTATNNQGVAGNQTTRMAFFKLFAAKHPLGPGAGASASCACHPGCCRGTACTHCRGASAGADVGGGVGCAGWCCWGCGWLGQPGRPLRHERAFATGLAKVPERHIHQGVGAVDICLHGILGGASSACTCKHVGQHKGGW